MFGGLKMLEIKIKDVNDVSGSIWLATVILTYERYLRIQDKRDKLSYKDFAFKQTDIHNQKIK